MMQISASDQLDQNYELKHHSKNNVAEHEVIRFGEAKVVVAFYNFFATDFEPHPENSNFSLNLINRWPNKTLKRE